MGMLVTSHRVDLLSDGFSFPGFTLRSFLPS